MASTKEWFESVAEAQRRAKRRLPRSVYGALLAGSEQGVTLGDNVAAFAELGFRPHVADLPRERSQAVTVLGQDLSMPVLISPTGVQAITPEGEVAVARAAAAAGTVMGLSSFASKPIEEVVAANDRTFFQLYWAGTRDRIAQRVERARKAGAKALIVTLDWTFSTRRDWGSPPIPEQLDLRTMLRFAPEVLVRPRWLLEYLRARTLPELTVPNMAVGDEPAPTFFGAYGEWMQTPLPTWDDVAWLRKEWDGPFVVKGIGRPDDARRAVDLGASAISVSNHGGNNLDSTPGSIRLLPSIVEAVGDQVEVLLDGGVRRGADVVKALALGA
ncbi:MAG TPA: pre-mycofactocin synthase MftD, partial [Acidimicrobiales bacterium]|nr:pre-mycofactocin synthase MftD [Acidimicrobiales bacterium]